MPKKCIYCHKNILVIYLVMTINKSNNEREINSKRHIKITSYCVDSKINNKIDHILVGYFQRMFTFLYVFTISQNGNVRCHSQERKNCPELLCPRSQRIQVQGACCKICKGNI